MKRLFILFLAFVACAGTMFSNMRATMDMSEADVVFTTDDFNGHGTAGTGGLVEVTKDGVTFTCDKAYGDQFSVRCYKNGVVIITSDQYIEKLAFEFQTVSDKYYNGDLDEEIIVNGTEWNCTLNSQARFRKISVYLGFDPTARLVFKDGLYYSCNYEDYSARVIASQSDLKYSGDVVIPSEIECDSVLFSVVNIADSAFAGCTGLTSVTMPNSITSIGDYAFLNCTSLISLTIPSSVVSIGENAFSAVLNICYSGSEEGAPWGARNLNGFVDGYLIYSDETKNSLVGCGRLVTGDVILPNSVTSIGDYTFSNCRSLTSVEIPNNVTSIGQCAFLGCAILTSVVVPNGVANIEDSVFSYCVRLSNVSIPNSVTSIGDGAFYDCSSLTSIYIPNSVTNIGECAFCDCSGLTYVSTGAIVPPELGGNMVFPHGISIYIPCGTLDAYLTAWSAYSNALQYPSNPHIIHMEESYEQGRVDISDYSTICDSMPVLTATPYYGYHFVQWNDGNTENPRSIVLTQDTTFTAEFAVDKNGTCGDNLALRWEYDSNSKSLTISGIGALNSNCTFGVEAPNSVEKLVIAEGVTSIGNSAFAEYSTLKHLSVAASVKTIHEQAFYNCTDLEEIYCYRATPPTAYSNTFDGIEKFECVLHVLSASVDMYKAATGWRDFYYVQTIDAVEVTDLITDVTVVPTDNTAEVTWPAVEQAATYTLVISKDGVVFFTLFFNANGQLQGIAFAPSRNDHHHAPTAVKTSNGGLRFTVTGLDSGTNYHLTLNTKDSDDQVIASYTSDFTTSGVARGIEDVKQNVQAIKILHNGQILILRGDRTYTVTGQEVR